MRGISKKLFMKNLLEWNCAESEKTAEHQKLGAAGMNVPKARGAQSRAASMGGLPVCTSKLWRSAEDRREPCRQRGPDP